MEQGPRIETKKELTSGYILNNLNGLFKSTETINHLLAQGSEEALDSDVQELRATQVKLYKELVKNTLGLDIGQYPQHDPFFLVTGINLEYAYKGKHDIAQNKFEGNAVVFMPSTILLPGDYLLGVDDMGYKYEEEAEDLAGSQEYSTTRALFHFFDPVTINSERNWQLQFGFSTFSKKRESDKIINQGTIVLEPGPLELIANAPESIELSKKLHEMLTWFNHDMTAHGTFLPNNGTDLNAMRAGGRADIMDAFFTHQDRNEAQIFSSTHAGELWSLNIHRTIFHKFVEERPAIMRYLRSHLDRYSRLVTSATSTIPNKELAKDCQNYFMKSYAFGFFRLVDPKLYRDAAEFSALRSRYPDLYDLGPQEDNAREYVFGEQGLVKDLNGEQSMIPHSEVFDILMESIKKIPSYEATLERLLAKLKGEKNLPQEDKIALKRTLGQMSASNVSHFICNIFGFTDYDHIGKFSAAAFIRLHKGQAMACLLEEGVTARNFQEKLAKRVYGFLFPHIHKQYMSKDDLRKKRK